tara:strand:+ start:144 stop:599 length:456 start_codon:yes stop_codon:yes gene_type:complete
MEKALWGRITWYLFHTIAEKIKQEYFVIAKATLILFIRQICANLPCPVCAQHAKDHLSKVNFELIQTKDHLKQFVFAFHNRVNMDLEKPTASIDILSKYESANFDKILDMFIKIHHNESYSNKFMMKKHYRNEGIKNFVNWYSTNKYMFLS